ncbi:hypothetical protein ACQP2T_63380 (plasmid) [Nonomuraea sp. CA-143628]|uniref:hypothetical protein n=1 Tax=Nonomuraea sp. CA-143628 TaxID=3239997 RepID=UPI003D8C2A5B
MTEASVDVVPASMDGSACLAYVHGHEVAYSWHQSVVGLLGYDLAKERRVLRGGYLGMRYGTGGIVDARNATVARFLQGEGEWLFWTDTDMGFTEDTLDRLVAAADPAERPIVGALCFSQQEYALDGMGGHRTRPCPTLFRWAEVGDGRQGFTAWLDYPREQLVEVAATGSACIVIHRDVLGKVTEQYGQNWYGRMANPTTGLVLSEDLSFCARAVACGYPIFVDTRVKTTHLKQVWIGEDVYSPPVAEVDS